MGKIVTTESFIEDCRKIHGDFYDYSRVEYTSGKGYVTIGCPIHGFFDQRSINHKSGRGCRECKYEKNATQCLHTKDQVLRKFKEVHGNRYDYSISDIKRTHDNIMILCREHGVFSQAIGMHKSGQGCPECGKISSIKSRSINIDELKKNINDTHQGKYKKYDYSGFKNGRSKIKIFCDNHGWFEQEAAIHAKGRGCQKCARESSRPPTYSDGFFDNEENKYLPATFYCVEITNNNTGKVFHKVGISRKENWRKRFAGFGKMGFKVKPLKIMKSAAYECWELETLVLNELEASGRLYKVHDLKGTYIAGWTECYYPKEWYN
jgi:hypothetical protein